MTIKALIFDFDGTILDTETPDFHCWQEIYRERGCELTLEAWSQCVGTTYHSWNPYDHLAELSRRPVDRAATEEAHYRRFLESVKSQPVLPGVVELILAAKARGLQLAVASSGTHEWVEGHLRRLGLLHHFDCIRCQDDVAKVKPDPELYVSVLRCLRLHAEEAIAIEDSPNGIRAARAAGIYTVAVPNSVTATLPLEDANCRFGCLSECELDRLFEMRNAG